MNPIFCLILILPCFAGPSTERAFEWQSDVDAPVRAVWDALTTQEGLESWMAPTVEVDLRLGGTLRMNDKAGAKPGDPGDVIYTIRAFEPLRLFSTSVTAPANLPEANDTETEWGVTYLEEISPTRTHVRFVWFGRRDAQTDDAATRAFDRRNEMRFSKLCAHVQSKPAWKPGSTVSAGRSIVNEAVVAAPIDAVWGAFTTQTGVQSWMVPVADVDFRLDGTIRTNYDAKAKIGDPGTIVQHILTYEPKRMFAMRFDVPATAAKLKLAEKCWTILTFDTVSESSTKVRCAMLGFLEGEEWNEPYKHFQWGNDYTLKKLVARFAKSTEAGK